MGRIEKRGEADVCEVMLFGNFLAGLFILIVVFAQAQHYHPTYHGTGLHHHHKTSIPPSVKWQEGLIFASVGDTISGWIKMDSDFDKILALVGTNSKPLSKIIPVEQVQSIRLFAY